MSYAYTQGLRRLHEAARKSEIRAEHQERFSHRAPVRRKCFISYHAADIDAVTDFVEEFSGVFIPRVIGASESDHFGDPINSQTEEYIKKRIGEKYLSDSTVTILYVGKCTWARKYVDWEIASSLRDDSVNKRNGLLAITPKSLVENKLPERFRKNYSANGESYAHYYQYPNHADGLRQCIEVAFESRTSHAHLINHGGSLRERNSSC